MVYYGNKAWIAIKAFEKSTHTITYAPVDEKIDQENQEWATSQAELDKQQKMFREDLEEYMPEFAPDSDDRKIHSF